MWNDRNLYPFDFSFFQTERSLFFVFGSIASKVMFDSVGFHETDLALVILLYLFNLKPLLIHSLIFINSELGVLLT